MLPQNWQGTAIADYPSGTWNENSGIWAILAEKRWTLGPGYIELSGDEPL